MNTSRFTARSAVAEQIDTVLTVGVADRKINTSRYLMFQLELEPSPQDETLGLVGVHVEHDDQSQGAYDGVRSCLLQRTELVVHFTAPTAQLFGIESVCAVLEVTDDDFATLRTGLDRLFRATPGVLLVA